MRSTSTILGKVADGKGQPIAGLTIVARQVSPPGEELKGATDAKGAFLFKRLSPAQRYAIFPVSDRWKASTNVTVQGGPKAQTYALSSSLVVRVTLSPDGVITDSKSGLQ
ncbi:MAG: carboxypeptidase-like regulatory domain-containing protein [Syntrophorhabdales bacterium]